MPSGVTVRYRKATGAAAWNFSEETRSVAETDYTAVVRLDGLDPATPYEYQVLLNGVLAMGEDRLVFQTFPPAAEPAAFRVAFGGCAGFVPWYERMWHTIAAKRPDALFMLGDNVYIDHPEMPTMQRYKYYRRQSRNEWRALTSRVPVFAIYDDHDFGDNDTWGGPDIEHPAWKRPAWKVFTQNWANPAYGGGEAQPGCWFDFSIADIDVFMLDGRYYRTDPDDTDNPSRSMLGPAQKAWFLEALGKSKATFKLLISSVAWADGTKPGSPDTWEGYAEERAEIFDFIKDRRIEGVILLSSDRHRSDLWRTDYPGLYPLYEFNSGQLTNQHTHPEMENAVFSYNRKQSFGLIDFDTTKTDPSVSYTIVTIDGENIFHHEVRRSELTFDAP
jgi:alkaline phosphatase D